MLAAMKQAFFSLFLVRDVVKGLGIRVTDILRDREHLLADVNLSQSATEGLVLASRVLPFEDFVMTTGAALPVEENILKRIADFLDETGMSHEDIRNLPRKAWSEFETVMIQACLQGDGDQQIAYQDVPGEDSPAALLKDPDSVGRNDPCLCGSGIKYKKCCGRP